MKSGLLKKLLQPRLLESTANIPSEGRKDLIKLDLNESYYFLNDEIVDEFKKLDYFILSSYPEYGQLTGKIAEYAKRKNAEVCLTSGSDQAIQMLLQLFFHAGDEVVIPAPTFGAYFPILNLIEARPRTILYRDNGNTFDFPFDETLASLNASSKGLILCNPNNPLGSSIAQDKIKSLLDKAHFLEIPVIIDEAYFEYLRETAAKFLDQYDNLIIIRTFSKAFGLAGLRLGYVLAHENIISELVKLKMPWAVNHFAVHAGEVVLRYESYFKQKIKEAIEQKKKLASLLEDHGLKCYKTETNFLIVKSPNHLKLIEDLKKFGIAVKDLANYPYGDTVLKNALRINVPSPEDMKKLEEFFKTHDYR